MIAREFQKMFDKVYRRKGLEFNIWEPGILPWTIMQTSASLLELFRPEVP